ncbi:MAG: SoxR reducing system RseC family protein [Planctomycetota bacterium]
MKYHTQSVLVREVHTGAAIVIEVAPAAERIDGCRDCHTEGGCSLCAERPGAAIHRVPITDPTTFRPGDFARLSLPTPPFGLALALVFLLPLVLVAGLPLAALGLARATGSDLFTHPAAVAIAAALGLTAAVLINLGVNRAIIRRHPPRLEPAPDLMPRNQ